MQQQANKCSVYGNWTMIGLNLQPYRISQLVALAGLRKHLQHGILRSRGVEGAFRVDDRLTYSYHRAITDYYKSRLPLGHNRLSSRDIYSKISFFRQRGKIKLPADEYYCLP